MSGEKEPSTSAPLLSFCFLVRFNKFKMAGHHLRREDFVVGWVSALPIELAAARKMLDEEYDYNYDDSTYTLGRMGEHNVVIACFPAGQLGISTGATAAADLKSKFPALEFCLMVGIGGGVPSPENDIRLGDVVISKPEGTYGGVVQYDLGKTVSGGHQMRTGFLNAPPAAILKTVARFQSNHALGKDNMSTYLSQLECTQFDRRKAGPDVLFQSSFRHREGSTCADCPQEMTVPRPPRTGSTVAIHYGTIASGNQVMKDAITRDRLSFELGGVLCFEMEAAGLMNNMPCLVIRGISDYSDSHKNSSWQPYAAAIAAACAKDILRLHPTNSGLKRRKEILDWIAPPEQEQRHSFVTGSRVHGTGRWLLDHPIYTEWRDNLTKSNVLWCYGMEGSGKTVLMSVRNSHYSGFRLTFRRSTVIDDLRNRLSAKGVPVIFFYLDYEHQARQTMAYFLKSLLRQLLDHILHIPKPLVEAFNRLGGSQCSLSAPVLEKIVVEVMQSSSQVYVLIDALDECIDSGRRKTIISFMEQAARSRHVRLLLTSRPHVQEIRSTFDKSYQILVRASEADIRAYVSQEISRARVTDIVDTSFVHRIMDTIIHQAEGMSVSQCSIHASL
jgi:nucleoside phosphorylase